jgi:cytochrome P450
LTELAINGAAQRQVQDEVRLIFGDTTPKTWDYESSINKLLGGFTGAVLNEQLRPMPPVTAIPKRVPKSHDQTISLDGNSITLPAGAHINLCTIGVHRNPKYWPTEPSKISNRPDDLDDFKPERWFLKNSDDSKRLSSVSIGSTDDEFEGFTGTSLYSKHFRPVTGSYLPFSEGARSCLGRH